MDLLEAKQYLNKNGYILEDWKSDVRKYQKLKGVSRQNEDKLEELKFKIVGKKGNKFEFEITPPAVYSYVENDKVYVTVNMNGKYLCGFYVPTDNIVEYFKSDEFNNKLFKSIKSRYNSTYDDDEETIEQYKERLEQIKSDIDSLQDDIELEIDQKDLNKKLRRFSAYANAVNTRRWNKNDASSKAINSIDAEVPIKVGDFVSNARPLWHKVLNNDKTYKVEKIENGYATCVPTNGRGKTVVARLDDIKRDLVSTRMYLYKDLDKEDEE